MARKELSPYAPDRWIRELNRRYPSLWADLRKGYVDPVRMLRPGSGGMELLSNIPDWCISAHCPTLNRNTPVSIMRLTLSGMSRMMG